MKEVNTQVYASREPSPPIRVKEKNIFYAEILMYDYTGYISEFTATSQYVCRYFGIDKVDKNLDSMYIQISRVEMYHLDILGQVITLLGGNPKYRGSESTNFMPWNGTFVYYGEDICDRLYKDLESEYSAISSYKKHIEMIDDDYIREILQRIILYEEVHIKHFKADINRYCN
jgi:bacterioferritin